MIRLNGSPLNVTLFSDGTSQVWKLPESILKDTNYAFITWEFSHEGELMHLAQLKMLLDKKEFTSDLTITYLPYGRQDKFVNNDATFALHTFANILNSLHFSNITIIDPHSSVALEVINNSEAVYPVNEVMGIAYNLKANLFCYPDKGAVIKYTGDGDVQKEIYDYPCVYGEKVRDQLTGNITSYKLIGDVKGKNVLIVDDICDGGMTFKLLAKELLDAGAKEINLFVSHGIFSKGLKTILDSGIKRVFTKDGEVSENSQGLVYKRL